MSLYSIFVVNTAPGCNNSIEQQLNVSGCTNYILRLASNSNALGPFNVYLNLVDPSYILYSAVTRSQLLGGLTISIECTLTPTPSITPSNNTPTPTPSNTPTITPTTTSTATPIIPTSTQTSSITPTTTPTVTNTPSITSTSSETPTPTPTTTNTPSITPTSTETPTPTPTITNTASITASVSNTPSITPTNTETPTPTQTFGFTQTPTPSQTETPTQTPSQTETPTPTPTITSTLTQTISPTPTQSTSYYVAYLFPEPLDSASQADLGQYLYDNGALWYGFGNSGGVPNISTYSADMDLYVHYSGWNGSSGSFVTPVSSLTGAIRQNSGIGSDIYGCEQNQYTFGTIPVSSSMINNNIQYNYTIWLPLAGLGGTFNNMTVDVGNSPCGTAIYDGAIPEPVLAATNVVVSSGAAIPAGTYRVLWNFKLPPTPPINYTLYFKGDTKT